MTHVRIEPRSSWLAVDWREVWHFRELLFFLVWRDVKVRYKQTIIGIAWVVLQPLVASFIFAIIFGNFARMPSDNLPYVIFAMGGLVPWNFFANSIQRGTGSLVGSAGLISKVYFPRLIIPVASILAGLVDLAVVLIALLVLMLLWGVVPTFAIITLPLMLLLAFGIALGASLGLTAINVQYRDVGYAMPVVMQLWLYATPVIYSSSLIPENWRWLYGLNPMVGVIGGFRWALFGTGMPPLVELAFSLSVMIAMLVGGVLLFNRMESKFADVV